MSDWTYGAEHEWADHPRSARLPGGTIHNHKDVTCVNSNGIANDPTDRLYHYGGEINTKPTPTIKEQVAILTELKKILPTARVNYRSNLHIHIRVPGLSTDLRMLKTVQEGIHRLMPRLLPIIEPIPVPDLWTYRNGIELEGAKRRYNRRKVSHHTLLPPKRVQAQLEAKDLEEFYAREVPRTADGTPKWHLQPRVCVNLRQLRETDTIEFRHFPGTLDEQAFATALEWCKFFLEEAMAARLNDEKILLDWARTHRKNFPTFPPYIHHLEVRYRATVHDGTVAKEDIVKNIRTILDGKFDKFPVVKVGNGKA